jgi:4-oxalocrotonate tautomerase
MPHVIIKMYQGRSESQKDKVAQAVTKALTGVLGLGEESISIAIEDVAPHRWTQLVYEPDILAKSGTIYKKPGYATD